MYPRMIFIVPQKELNWLHIRGGGHGGTTIHWHSRTVLLWWSAFSIWLGHYFMAPHGLTDSPFLQNKICLSSSHLFPDLIGHKVGSISHANQQKYPLKAFCKNVLLNVLSSWPLFSHDDLSPLMAYCWRLVPTKGILLRISPHLGHTVED